MTRSPRLPLYAALMLSLALPLGAGAQEQGGGREQAQGQQQEARRPRPEARDAQALPAESVTRHTLQLPGCTLSFTATAGHLTLTDQQGAPQAELDLQLQRPGFLMPSVLLGLGFTALGGFVAGRLSGRLETIHGCLVGSVCLVLGILLWPLSASVPAWYTVVSLLGSVPLGLLGGYLAENTRGVPLL